MNRNLSLLLIILIIGCASQESLYREVVEINEVENYEQYIKKHPDGEYTDRVRKALENLEFENARKTNTIESFEQFITNYPKSEFIENAKYLIAEIKFNNANQNNSKEEFDKFLDEYKSRQEPEYQRLVEQAHLKKIKIEFSNAIEKNKISNIAEFLNTHEEDSQYYNAAIEHIKRYGLGYVDENNGIIVEIYEFETSESLKFKKGSRLTASGTEPIYEMVNAPKGKTYVMGTVDVWTLKKPITIKQNQIVVSGANGTSKLKIWKFLKAWLAERIFGFLQADDRESAEIDGYERIGFLLEAPTRGLEKAIFSVMGIETNTVGFLTNKKYDVPK